MKTIKTRAKKALAKWDIEYFYHYSDLTEDSFKDGYVEGATEQREIDIEKACQWLECYGDDARWEKPSDKIKEFRRAMEED